MLVSAGGISRAVRSLTSCRSGITFSLGAPMDSLASGPNSPCALCQMLMPDRRGPQHLDRMTDVREGVQGVSDCNVEPGLCIFGYFGRSGFGTNYVPTVLP